MAASLTLGLGSPSPLTLTLRPQPQFISQTLHFSLPSKPTNGFSLKVNAMSSNGSSSKPPQNPLLNKLKITAASVVFAASVVGGRFHTLPARAEPPVVAEEEIAAEDGSVSSPLTRFLESNSEAVEALKKLLQQKLELREDEEALKIVNRLILAQPEEKEWNFLKARLLSEMGRSREARQTFEEILARNPLLYEALFENALLMDRSGERDDAMGRLEEALKIAEEQEKVKEARDVRLIMAQIEFLHKNAEGALKSYDELAKEDPSDFRPHFCKGMIYSLLDRNKEAREEFAKYRELSPKKFEVEGYLRTSLSKMKLFGTDEEN